MDTVVGSETPVATGTKERPVRGRWLRSPIARRRWQNFKATRRAFWSLWIFVGLFGLSLVAELITNNRPIVVEYRGQVLFPIFVDYPESKFGGFLATTDYRDTYIRDEILGANTPNDPTDDGWMFWPLGRYGHGTVDRHGPGPSPTAPWWTMSRQERCAGFPGGIDDPDCVLGNFHWLGTDDQGRDVLARVIYGFRLSVVFGLILAVVSSVIGVIAGAVQGYFGGWVDLIAQRVLEVWGSVPTLYLMLIIFTVIAPGFWIVLGLMILFSWTSLVGIVRAEFLRARNFEYINAARALGVSNLKIMFRHLLPNATVATLTMVPFIVSGSIGTLAALDFLGYGMPPGSPSLGELLQQGKDNLYAAWLGLTAFFTIAILLSLLIFVGEGVRNAFDPRKTFSSSDSGR